MLHGKLCISYNKHPCTEPAESRLKRRISWRKRRGLADDEPESHGKMDRTCSGKIDRHVGSIDDVTVYQVRTMLAPYE